MFARSPWLPRESSLWARLTVWSLILLFSLREVMESSFHRGEEAETLPLSALTQSLATSEGS